MANSIEIGINAPFDLGQFNKNHASEYQTVLKKIYNAQNVLRLSDLNDKDKYNIICINANRNCDSSNENTSSEEQIIYRIHKDKIEESDEQGNKKCKDFYTVETGFHIGCIVIDNQKITITNGYDNSFLQRLIRFSNRVYVNSTSRFEQSNSDYDLFNVLEYLFLSSLKSVLSLGIPKLYKKVPSKNWNIKGNVDWKKYFNKDMYDRCGVSYVSKEQCFDSEINHVLSYAIKLCDEKYLSDNFKEIIMFEREITGFCPSSLPSKKTLNRALNSPLLSNGLYSGYKKVLTYAEMIIEHKSLLPDNKEGKKAVGWIIDITELWEDYLVSVLNQYFADWRIIPQNKLSLYDETFYHRYNFPDVILEKNNHLIILDAKFKKMDFTNQDVDRADLHQIQSYYGYYLAQNKYEIDCVALIYPSRTEPKADELVISNIFGLSNAKTKFCIGYIRVGATESEQIQYEKEFAERLKKLID